MKSLLIQSESLVSLHLLIASTACQKLQITLSTNVEST